MAARLTPFGFLVKWIVVPVAVAAGGYYVVGPRISGSLVEDIRDQAQAKIATVTGGAPKEPEPQTEPAKPTVPTAAEVREKARFAPPQVEVSVRKLENRVSNKSSERLERNRRNAEERRRRQREERRAQEREDRKIESQKAAEPTPPSPSVEPTEDEASVGGTSNGEQTSPQM